jgi:hypothetical protein
VQIDKGRVHNSIKASDYYPISFEIDLEAVDFLIFDQGPSWEHHHFADEALKEAAQDLLASADDTGCTADLTVASADALTKVKHILAKTPWSSATQNAFFHCRGIKSKRCS